MNCRACNAPLTPILTKYEDGIPVCYLCYNIHHGNIDKDKLEEKLDGRDFMMEGDQSRQ